MSSKLASIADELSSIIAITLDEFRPQIDVPIKVLALDFHPWNGFLGMAMLTEPEFEADPLLDDPSEMAAWKHYDFGANLGAWSMDNILAEIMTIYNNSKDSHSLFQCCASAMAAPSVQQSVSKYNLADGFRISVANPDDNIEYYV